MTPSRSWLILGIAIAAGAVIAWMDTRPGWDDAGITAVLILVASLIGGSLLPNRAWAAALAVGAWVPLVEVVRDRNYGSLLALAVAFAGAYAGAFARRGLSG